MFETVTTELWLLYTYIGISGILFCISLAAFYIFEIDVIAIISMCLSTLLNFKISNIFIDGTLSKTFIEGGVPVVQIIRNSAASNLFEFFGIITFVLIILQIYVFIKEKGVQPYEEDF